MKKSLIVLVVLCVLLMCSCGKKADTSESDGVVSNRDISQSESVAAQDEITQTEGATQSVQISLPAAYTQNTLPDTTKTQSVQSGEKTTVPSVSEVEKTHGTEEKTTARTNESQSAALQTTARELKKTGEMEFSDSKDNKYLASVAKKYGLNTDNLAAIYTVPDNNGNIVLEFDGSRDTDGKLIRTADTLIAVYSIDKDFNSKRASENAELNEYSYGEMKVMFMSTTKFIMPKFEKELG